MIGIQIKQLEKIRHNYEER